ncbi:MAG: PLP-dependent transferase [Lachnospiraceae bacterium]|nr:PLP-dependent transferase [Lachnospiraceae bacterium]
MDYGKSKKWNVSFDTKCQGTDLTILDQYNAISYPIYQTATFSHRHVGEQTGFDYSRQSNPTRQQLESVVALLENGEHALAFSSGMAAVAAVMELFKPGDHLIVDEDLYGGSIRLFNTISAKNGIEFTVADVSSGIEEQIRPQTKAVYLETPTNPMMHVTDIRALAEVTKAHGILLIVDNTFLSPRFQNPLDLGADIVIHSGTKYIAGHHDTIGGLVVLNDDELDGRLRLISTTTGAAMAPFDSWLTLRGIRTLAVRMDRAQENALRIAEYLKQSPYVTRVIYPGLPEHPGYEIMKKQASGFGAMISFEVRSAEFARAVLENVELFYFAESLGGTETLITYPLTQTHAAVPQELREKNGITDRLLRLSVGIENAQDLIDEFERVFTVIGKPD